MRESVLIRKNSLSKRADNYRLIFDFNGALAETEGAHGKLLTEAFTLIKNLLLTGIYLKPCSI